jgi:hypothetical protein
VADTNIQALEGKKEDADKTLADRMTTDVVDVRLQTEELMQLSAKTAEILQEAALAHERITKDLEEIELLKTETRAMLTSLRAA